MRKVKSTKAQQQEAVSVQVNLNHTEGENQVLTITKVNEVDVIDSRIVAAELGVQHESIIRVITDNEAQIMAQFGVIRFSDLKSENPKGGRAKKIAYLTEEQSYAVVTLARNTKEAVALKMKLVKSFMEAKKAVTLNSITEYFDLDGERYYLYVAFLKRFGYGTASGSSDMRRLRYPQFFKKHNVRWYLSEGFAKVMLNMKVAQERKLAFITQNQLPS